MRRFITPLVALFACVVPTLTAHSADDDLYFNWIQNYDEAMRQAKVTGKPLLLSFRCVP